MLLLHRLHPIHLAFGNRIVVDNVEHEPRLMALMDVAHEKQRVDNIRHNEGDAECNESSPITTVLVIVMWWLL